jgi:hypothetical protein
MAVETGRLGWIAVPVGTILCAIFASTITAQSVRRLPVELPAERPPVMGLKVVPTPATTGVAATADEVVEQMARAAGVIFAGQVTAVRFPAGLAAGGVVQVEFRVDEAVRGPAAGSVYTLREWAGLWNAIGGGGRYRPGQRLLVFLYAPDARGMSSPVRGLDGAVPLRGGGAAPGPDTATTAAAEWMADLRWVRAQALKTLPSPVASGGGGPVSPRPISPRPVHPLGALGTMAGGVGPDIETAREAIAIEPPPVRRLPVFVPMPPVASADTQPLAQVIALCREAIGGSDGRR